MIEVEVHQLGSILAGPDIQTISGVKRLMKKKLTSIGADGVWKLWAIKRDSPKPSDLHVKGLYSGPRGAKNGVKCVIRPPGGGDMSWEYLVEPPPIYSLSEVQQKLKGEETEGPPQAVEPAAPEPQLVCGKVYEAEIAGIKPFGFLVAVKGVQGLLPLDQVALVYDKDNLKRWRVGESIKVLCTSTNPDVKFSRAALLAMNTEEPNVGRVYLGVPDASGTLSMEGFIDSMERKHQLLVWMAELQKEMGAGQWIPYERVSTFIGKKLMEQTGASKIHALGLASIFKSLVSYEWLEIEDKKYRVTDWGIEESAATIRMPAAAPAQSKQEPVVEVAVSAPTELPSCVEKTPFEDTNEGKEFLQNLHEFIASCAGVTSLDEDKAKPYVRLAISMLHCTAHSHEAMEAYCNAYRDSGIQAKRVLEHFETLTGCCRKIDTLLEGLRKSSGLMTNGYIKLLESLADSQEILTRLIPVKRRDKILKVSL